jgi:hypothetical protein
MRPFGFPLVGDMGVTERSIVFIIGIGSVMSSNLLKSTSYHKVSYSYIRTILIKNLSISSISPILDFVERSCIAIRMGQ